MTSPRETARQIAVQQIADDEQRADAELLDLWRSVRGPYAKLDGSLIRFAAKVRASLTAELAQARQERDAAQKAMAYSSEQAHLEWTRANKAEGDLAAAEQARAEAYAAGHAAALTEVNLLRERAQDREAVPPVHAGVTPLPPTIAEARRQVWEEALAEAEALGSPEIAAMFRQRLAEQTEAPRP